MDRHRYSEGSWGKIDVLFSSKPRYIPEIEIEYRVLMNDRKTVLKGTQTCTNITKANRHYTSIFIYPAILEKYRGEIYGVVVLIKLNGTYVASLLEGPIDPNYWWNKRRAYARKRKNHPPKFKWLENGTMTNWHFTPFDLEDIERYETLKIK